MKRGLLLILPLLAVLTVAACAEEKKGNPALLQEVQELAQKGCECTDKDCLWNVTVNGKSYLKVRGDAGQKDFTDDEKNQFNAALGKWAECEFKITQAN